VARQFELEELAQEDTETHKGVVLKFQNPLNKRNFRKH